MSEQLDRELLSVSMDVFEQLCFMYPSPELENDFQNMPTEAVATVEFEGPRSGKLCFIAGGGLLTAIASNMMGEDDPSRSRKLDALCEITNVICGNILPYVAGSSTVFRIDIPKTIDPTEFLERRREKPSASVHLNLDKGRADILLFLNGKSNRSLRERADD